MEMTTKHLQIEDHRKITPANTEFVILSFEGPDRYSLAGGLGVRINHLSSTLAQSGFRTHLFFIGDPGFAGEEARCHGKLVLHRWCQWISKYYPNGVYDGEDQKWHDFNQSIPAFIQDHIARPAILEKKRLVILGEEWQTAEVMARLNDVLQKNGLRDQVVMFWNANNTFSFDRIDWNRLNRAVAITTVSKYMKHVMWRMGINPIVIPNGIPRSLLRRVDEKLVRETRAALEADLLLCKIARWDPGKGWNAAVQAIARLKGKGLRSVLVARGGIESHGIEVVNNARSLGLVVKEARIRPSSQTGYLAALRDAAPADIVDVKFHLPLDFLRILYRASDAVLANSGHEPFGIVGLEAMAAGGIAFTGCTGEDYAIPFVNSLVLETADPMEIVGYLVYLRERPQESQRIRKAARDTARYFTWEAAANNLISKLENQARIQEMRRIPAFVAHTRPVQVSPESPARWN